MSRIYIDRYTGRISRTDLYLVSVTLKDGTVLEDLEPRRLFPISQKDMYITLLDRDEKEAAVVRALDELDEDSARALCECFDEFYRIPRITRVLSCNEKSGGLTWLVETNYGKVKFRVSNRYINIKKFPKGRVVIRDTNDNRYEIVDWNALDAHSRHLTFPFM